MTDPTPLRSAWQGDALAVFLETVEDASMAQDVGPHLRCSEADSLIELLRSHGRHEAAFHWLTGHAYRDDDEGEPHVQGSLTRTERPPLMSWG